MELEGNLFFGIEDQPAPLGDESKDLSPILFKLSMKRKIYSKDLGINLETCKEEEFFKWFLACLLFGKPIQQKVAKRTYFEFRQAGILTSEKILEAGWDKLVEILDRGGYVRYDFSTATKLLEICKELKESSALYDFRNVCDKTNNTDYIIDLQMGVLDTYVEIVKGMGIIINQITILKKGTIESSGFINK